jgi:hypothetical protein
MNSTSDTAKVCVIVESQTYVIDGAPCGPLLFQNMSKHTMLFDPHVKEIIAGLQAGGGGGTYELAVNLLKAYIVVSDSEFSRDDYTDGAAMNSQTLMTVALVKYHSL